jgi:hypothetical protein
VEQLWNAKHYTSTCGPNDDPGVEVHHCELRAVNIRFGRAAGLSAFQDDAAGDTDYASVLALANPPACIMIGKFQAVVTAIVHMCDMCMQKAFESPLLYLECRQKLNQVR